jgi:hypothetical protein
VLEFDEAQELTEGELPGMGPPASRENEKEAGWLSR